MAKFCPACGNQMSDNSKFCMECGAKLSDYSSGGVKIGDGLVQRSKVGAASVGTVNISPVFSNAKHVKEKDICPKCGFTMRKLTGGNSHEISANGITTVLYINYNYLDAYVCPKCKYKCSSIQTKDYDFEEIWVGHYWGPCPKCGENVSSEPSLFGKSHDWCKNCGWKGRQGEAMQVWKRAVPLNKALQLAGYDVLC